MAVAVVPVRAGALPAGGAEVAAEAGGRVVLVGEGCEVAAKALAGVAPVVETWEAGPYAPAAWAVALAPLLAKLRASRWWLGWIVAGAIGPSAVALFIVFPLKGMAMAGGWDPKLIIGALLLNGAWGSGCAVMLRLMRSR